MGDWQERTEISVDALLDIEAIGERLGQPPSNIRRAFDHWSAQQTAGFVRADRFHFGDGATIVDATPHDPLGFHFIQYGGVNFRQMHGLTLGDFPIKQCVHPCAGEYFECRSSNRPLAQRIQHSIDGFTRDYVRLLLPLCDGVGRVTRLASVYRHLEPQPPAQSSAATATD
jgi:hypothetical protein